MDRRTFVAGAAATAGALKIDIGFAAERSGAASPLAATVRKQAEALSRKPYVAIPETMPGPLTGIGYDQWRDVHYKADRRIWSGEPFGFELDFFPTGYIYRIPVEVYLADGDRIEKFTLRRDMFTFNQLEDAMRPLDELPISGLRIFYPLNAPKPHNEIAVFQGASYFRAIGRGHAYGMSARGLALDPLSPKGEEFPQFTTFWIEKPKDDRSITMHALLDSPSVAGAYTFVIAPGEDIEMAVDAVLFPRVDLKHAGIAAFSSMFWHAPYQFRARDFRPRVHDSDGLLVKNAAGETLWRPLVNASTIQITGLVDEDPVGFGLMQRERGFDEFQDLEAKQELRPSAWVAPRGKWGEGHVELIELPTVNEYADNVVAFWRPREVLKAGDAYEYVYDLRWTQGDAPNPPWLRVARTLIGDGPREGVTRFIVEFEKTGAHDFDIEVLGFAPGFTEPDNAAWRAIEADLSCSGIGSGAPFVQYNKHVDGVRVIFDVDPKEQTQLDLRVSLRTAFRNISEVWIYRWTK